MRFFSSFWSVSWSTLAEEKSAPLAWGALWERAPKGWTEANLKTFIIILYSVTFSLRSSLLTKMDDQRENPTSWQRKRPTYNVNLVVNSTTKPSHLRALKVTSFKLHDKLIFIKPTYIPHCWRNLDTLRHRGGNRIRDNNSESHNIKMSYLSNSIEKIIKKILWNIYTREIGYLTDSKK